MILILNNCCIFFAFFTCCFCFVGNVFCILLFFSGGRVCVCGCVCVIVLCVLMSMLMCVFRDFFTSWCVWCDVVAEIWLVGCLLMGRSLLSLGVRHSLPHLIWANKRFICSMAVHVCWCVWSVYISLLLSTNFSSIFLLLLHNYII